MSRAFAAVHEWFFAPRPLHGLVLARILLGSALTLAYLQRLPEYTVLFGGESLAWFPPFRVFLGDLYAFPLSPLADTVAGMDGGRGVLLAVLYAVLLVAAASFTLGLFTRPAGLVTLALHSLFVTIDPIAYWGWSLMIQPYLLYVVLAPTDRLAAVDAWRRERRIGRHARLRPEAPAWPLRLLQIHVCVMYAEAGFSRIDSAAWQQGRMLFEAANNTMVSRFAMDWEPLKPLLAAFCLAVFVLEPASAFLLWPRLTRRWCALALLGMHLGIELLTRVGMWNFVMVAGLMTFLPDPWTRRLLEPGRWLPRRRRTRDRDDTGLRAKDAPPR